MGNQDRFLRELVHLFSRHQSSQAVSIGRFCESHRADPAEIEAFAAALRLEGSLVETIMPGYYRLTLAGYHKYSAKIGSPLDLI